jgi:hypothetical protein
MVPIDRDRLKDKRNTIHTERYYAEAPILEGQIVMPGSHESFCVPSTLNAPVLGIAQNAVSLDDLAAYALDEGNIARIEVQVIMLGVYICLAGNAITFGRFVVSDAQGRAIEAEHIVADPRHILGKAMRHADGDGEQIHVFLNIYDDWDSNRGQT